MVDDAGLRGGAAHVEGDGVADLEHAAQRLGADDAGGRPRLQHAHALTLRLLGLVEPAGRLHDQERAGETGGPHVRVDLADVTANFRTDIGVGSHGRATLELAILLRQLVRRRHEQRGMMFLKNRFRAPLVIGVGVAIEKQNRDCLDAEPVELSAERGDFAFVERLIDLAIGQHALFHLETHRALDQRHVLLKEQIVGVRPVDAPDLVDVAKAFSDEERCAGAGALKHGVDGDGRAVQEQRRGPIVAAGLGDTRGDALHQMCRRR